MPMSIKTLFGTSYPNMVTNRWNLDWKEAHVGIINAPVVKFLIRPIFFGKEHFTFEIYLSN